MSCGGYKHHVDQDSYMIERYTAKNKIIDFYVRLDVEEAIFNYLKRIEGRLTRKPYRQSQTKDDKKL